MQIVIPLEGRVRTVIRSSFVAAKRLTESQYTLSGDNFQMTGVTAEQVLILPDAVEVSEGQTVTDEMRMQALPFEGFIAVSAEEALPNVLGLLLRSAVADGKLTDEELLSVQPALEGRVWQPGFSVQVGDVYSYGGFLWRCIQAHAMLSILASFAQEESRSVSENCKWRIRNDFQRGKPSFFRIYGYKMKNGRLEIVPEEAEVVRMIFRDYLDGMGRELISKKLNEAHIPPMNSDQWWPSVITAMLKNECYVGDLRLQKTFVADHLQKKQLPNRGEMPQYLVHDAHEPIIDRETFDAVQCLTTIRIAHYHPNRDASGRYPLPNAAPERTDD